MSNTFKASKSLVLMAALLALLSSPAPGMAAGPLPVDLGSAGNFVILSEQGISTTAGTAIVGDIGVSPYAATAITGFGLIMDPSGQFSTSSLVDGNVYAADYAVPTPTTMTTAVNDMMFAYIDAASRAPTSPTIGSAGEIGGLTIYPGVYQWSSAVTISTDVTLSGGKNDVWIFQIAGTLNIASGGDIASGIKVKLAGGAKASNVFWQVAGATTLGTYSTFNGTILDQSNIALQTGAVMNGKALAQTAVTLQMNAITITTETKKECEGFLKAEKKVFDAGQNAAKKALNDAQNAAKHAFDAGQNAAKKAFDAGQNAAKQALNAGQSAARQALNAGQNAARQAFEAEQKTDMEQCKTLQ
jgi:hypothetical protein